MQTPKIPNNEDRRLSTLKSLKLLDTEPEERFDRLTRLAKRMFDVPIAVVSLVDENRQWFKSCIGTSMEETARDVSFCTHAILDNDVFLVPDATQDPDFADNPLVTGEPNIRFYAGCPLAASNGDYIGALCVIDHQPRNFNEQDIQALRDLAAMVESELAAVELATQDELTHISNRRSFIMQGENGISICQRQSLPATLSYFDLNSFKEINDNYGHSEGDAVLTNFAEMMTSEFRDSDLIARIGGDEFAILQINTSSENANHSLQRFQKRIENYNSASCKDYQLQFSFGTVEYNPQQHLSLSDLMREADQLMYIQKQSA